MSGELKAEIPAALWSLVDGVGATIAAIEAQPALMALESVVAEADGAHGSAAPREVIAGVVAQFLEDAADSLEANPDAHTIPNEAKAAHAALNLKAGLQGKPYTGVKKRPGRADHIARWLGYQAPSLKKMRKDGTSPLGVVIDGMVEQLVRREVDYLVDARRRTQRARRPPLESAMRVEWLDRFERYFKIWAPISGLRHDLDIALDARQHGDTAEADLFIRKSLYHHAGFLTELKSFVSQHGGLWIFPDTRSEDDIADSSWFIREPIRLGEINESILRTTLANAPEVTLFMHATYTDRHLQPILDVWQKWIQSCQCSRLNRPRNDCRVHATIRWASFYMDAVEAQWDFLADWYDLPRPGTKIDPVSQRKRGLPVLPPPLPVDNPVQIG
jgi:hypothetical protein